MVGVSDVVMVRRRMQVFVAVHFYSGTPENLLCYFFY